MDLDDEGRRSMAAALFNHTWKLLEKPDRSVEEDDEMLHAAHASAYHWLHAGGTAANRARSEWQCSRVYAVLGRGEPAVHHARRCLELCEAHADEMDEFDLPFAYEAMARAHCTAGELDAAHEWLGRARDAGRQIADEDDRSLLESDLATIQA